MNTHLEETQAGAPAGAPAGRVELIAGGLAAILASTCCLGALVLVLLGVSGAWIGNLSMLEPFRPAFIAAAVAALFFAYRKIFRPSRACAAGEVCALPAARAAYKAAFWIVAALILPAAGFPYILPLFYQESNSQREQPTLARTWTNCFSALARILGLAALGLTISASMALAAVKTVTLNVPGMTCAACPLTVKKALTKVEGVQKADVSLEKKQAIVTFDDQKTSIRKITEATKEAGYPSTVKQ